MQNLVVYIDTMVMKNHRSDNNQSTIRNIDHAASLLRGKYKNVNIVLEMWLTSVSIRAFEKYSIFASIRSNSFKDSCLNLSDACFMAWAAVSFAVDLVGNSRTLTRNVASC